MNSLRKLFVSNRKNNVAPKCLGKAAWNNAMVKAIHPSQNAESIEKGRNRTLVLSISTGSKAFSCASHQTWLKHCNNPNPNHPQEKLSELTGREFKQAKSWRLKASG